MSTRINYRAAAPDAVKALSGINAYLDKSAFDVKLRALLELRISQINGCAYCIDMHNRQARSAGETQQRLDCLSVWREVPFFDARERAALAWAESLTLIAQTHAPDADYAAASEQFNEKELVELTLLIVGMNAWNRVAIGFRQLPSARNE
ncbi:MAG: alkylhydroperoxidase [Nevskia sp.]|nr:alkylhydroperoxidase [Nevskia sp.]